MTGQPMNLRPYGNSWADAGAGSTAVGSMEEQALARARHKLASVRSHSGGDKRAGPDLLQLIPALLLALLFGGPCMAGAAALFGDKDAAAGGIVLLVLGLLIFLIPLLIWLQSKPATPKRALQAFYRAIGRGRYKRARALTVRADLDSFPRHQPVIPDLGRPCGFPRSFADERAFADYWRELTRSQPMPYCYARVRNVRETPVGADVMIVDFELRLVMNTSLWALLIFVALVVAAVLDLATRKRVVVPMRKLLVRVDDEWHLFSSEWQGYDEFNLEWLSSS
jgi:hypothetical protein